MHLEFDFRQEFGKERYAPRNENAKTLCFLMQRRSLTKAQVRLCKEKGWSVFVQCPAQEFMKKDK